MAAIAPVQVEASRTAANHPTNLVNKSIPDTPQLQLGDTTPIPVEGQLWPRGNKLGS